MRLDCGRDSKTKNREIARKLCHDSIKNFIEYLGTNWFGEVSVHACVNAFLEVPLHEMRCQSDYRYMFPSLVFLAPDNRSRLESVDVWHLHID